jgi:hypothetical protein
MLKDMLKRMPTLVSLPDGLLRTALKATKNRTQQPGTRQQSNT